MTDQTDIEYSESPSPKQSDARNSRSPGRPKSKTGLRQSILDEAELAFADSGFAGTTTRDIASRAGVNQNLIRYYFDTKKLLFDEVIRRRGAMLSGKRHVLLDRLIANNPSHTLEDVIRAYVQPQWDTKNSGPGGAAFVRLQARLHAEPDDQSLSLRREVYDAAVKRYIDVVQPLLPHLNRETISLRWAFLVGTYLFMLNDLGRIEDISEGGVTDLSNEEMLDNLVGFLAAGFRASAP
jgi:AcrR family transcriptional regulator